MTPTDWLLSGDTGISSETICAVMVGATARRVDIPYDTDDFGRCYRLLTLFPEWRARLPEVAKRFPKWGPMVMAWDELTSLYERLCDPDGRYTWASNKEAAKTINERMRALADDCRIADGWKRTGPGSWEKGEHSRVKVGSNLTIET